MQQSPEVFDVIIAGAGPAGCTAALALSVSGLKVALLTKHNGKEKVCGGALGPYIPQVLQSLNPDFSCEFLEWTKKIPADICKIFNRNNKSVIFRFPKPGWISRRSDFDDLMMGMVRKNSSVRIYDDCKMTAVEEKDEGIEIRTNDSRIFHGKIIIGCDGAHSLVRKSLLQESIDTVHHATAIRGYFKDVTETEEKTLEFHFLRELVPGYFWIFPVSENIVNAGLGIPTSRIRDERINIHALFNNLVESNKNLKRRFSHAVCENTIEASGIPYGAVRRKISGERFMLCGDAASIADPLTGEGIGQAMISGRYAAWHAMECFRQNRFDAGFMLKYDEQVYNKLWEKNRGRYRLNILIDSKPYLLYAGISLARRNRRFHAKVQKRLEM
jgi:geranylgeranyl reductase family protein